VIFSEVEIMYKVVQVRQRENGKVHYYNVGELPLVVGNYYILEGERGIDYGQVLSEAELLLDGEMEGPLRRIIRPIEAEDQVQIEANQKDAAAAFETCQEKIGEKNLPMKLVEVEYSFDRSRLLFYFTAEGRVDFRELVKELAGIFKTRIELRQIGVRDEAKMMGGVGPCGRPLCCTGFLHDFEPINIRMAKAQRLPLDPVKISGVCGRLLCCLKFEDEFYRQTAKKFPREGAMVSTPQGDGKVIDLNFIKGEVVVETEDEKKVVVPYRDVKFKR
jgi:cell fate regulator YaaT (PSP1 superfamily)